VSQMAFAKYHDVIHATSERSGARYRQTAQENTNPSPQIHGTRVPVGGDARSIRLGLQ